MKNRLLRKHNIGKLVLGQFLIVFAVWILNPVPVFDVAYLEVTSPFGDYYGVGLDEFKAGPNPLNETGEMGLDLTGLDIARVDLIEINTTVTYFNWSNSDDYLIVGNSTYTYINGSASTDDYTWLFPFYSYQSPSVPVRKDPWIDIGSVELEPGDYDIWVLYPARDDGKVNYRVDGYQLPDVRVVEPDEQITRKYGRDRFYLDCTFTVEEAGEYYMDAYGAALSQSRFMAVIPERPVSYYFALAFGWLLIVQVVTVKGHEFVKRRIERKRMEGRPKELYVFPPDVAYFFAMGPEPNWKGGAFYKFPRGTSEFFNWEPMSLEFPAGTAEFLDAIPGPS